MTTRFPPRSLSVTLAAALAAVMVPACTTIEPAPDASSATPGRATPSRVIQGSVVYRERVALPSNAQVRIQLVDAVTRAPEVIVLAETTFGAAGRQVPVPFALPVDTSKLEPGRSYAMRGYILIDGKVSYVTATRVNVDPHAAPAALTLLLAPGTSDPEVTDSPPPPGASKAPMPPARNAPRGSQQKPPPAK